jgi:dihydrofolate synthase/folylpolyglutamate synthase
VFQTYQEAISWLFNQFPSYQQIGAAAYKPDLANILILLNKNGNPEKKLKFIHVAGTNGKGTTSSIVASYLTEGGFNTGLFTSPHLLDFRERIRINGEMISEESVIDFCNSIQSIQEIEPSFFEISFAMAIYHFQQKKCEYCVIEVGMGGRLDATNCITPLISVITTIGLDHTQFLGNTRALIAGEKAGIIKHQLPVVIGEKDEEITPVFERKAKDMNSKIYFVDEAGFPTWMEKLSFPFDVGFQKQNAKTAFLTLEKLSKTEQILIDQKVFEKALFHLTKNSGYQKRVEVVHESPRVIIDVSHNLEGIKATLFLIQNTIEGKLFIVYGSSADKNYREIIENFPEDALIHLTTFHSERSWHISSMIEIKETNLDRKIELYENVNHAITDCLKRSTSHDTILVFGSFFLIQDITLDFKKLGI